MTAGLWSTAILVPAPTLAQSFAAADSAVRSGIERGIYPGAVLVVGRRDTVLYRKGYGHLTWSHSSAVPDPDSTLWDVASLTKVVATTAAMMLLVERGAVSLDAPVVRYLPRFTGGRKSEVTVRMLLNHTSGLPSYVEFFRLAPGRDSAITLLYGTPLRRPPGSSAEYSDLNAMLLGLLIETVSQQSLDRFATGQIFAPLSMEQTMFRPPESVTRRTAPTGRWNGHAMRGVVNDQNAVRLGGVSGHAGVFSTGGDLGRYARFWLSEGALNGRRLVRPETVRLFLTPSRASGTRLLGWDTPDTLPRGPSPYGTILSRSAYGHTGWTGTQLWIDPARNLFLVLLTNRSFAPRMGHSIRELRAVRAQVADAVVRAAGDQPAPADHR
jgi:CubicO group peptidase (beta-lactamase class C family)